MVFRIIFAVVFAFSAYIFYNPEIPNYRLNILITQEFSRYYRVDIISRLIYIMVMSQIIRRAEVSAIKPLRNGQECCVFFPILGLQLLN